MTAPVYNGPGTTGTMATALHVGTRAAQLGLAGIVGYSIVQIEIGLAVNTVLMLAIALLPDYLSYRYDFRPNPVVALLVAAAPFLHTVGAMGLYEQVPLFDQVAHATSAALVAGVGYVLVQVVDTQYDGVEIPGKLRFVFVLVFVMAFGVLWEIMEFATDQLATAIGTEQVLVQKGLTDTAMDMLFNTAAAVVVATWGTAYFDGVRRLVGQQADGSRE